MEERTAQTGEIVSGLRCTWFGPREELSASGNCLFCAGPVGSPFPEEKFWSDVDAVESGNYIWPTYKKTAQPTDWKPRPHPGYRAMWEWARTQRRCYVHVAHLRNSYRKHTGNEVEIEP
jgi:hypothetical protein